MQKQHKKWNCLKPKKNKGWIGALILWELAIVCRFRERKQKKETFLQRETEDTVLLLIMLSMLQPCCFKYPKMPQLHVADNSPQISFARPPFLWIRCINGLRPLDTYSYFSQTIWCQVSCENRIPGNVCIYLVFSHYFTYLSFVLLLLFANLPLLQYKDNPQMLLP